MKPGILFPLLSAAALAAALVSAPATAQRSVSGTIAAAPGTAGPAPSAAAATAAPAPAPAGGNTTPAAAATEASAPAPAPAAAPVPASASALALGLPPVAAPPAASSSSLLQTTVALMFVLALLVGLAWFLKRYGPKNFGGGSNTVRLVGALSVGARERILVVEVGEQWIVVGASPGRMNALATMPRQEGAADGQAGVPAALSGANFAEWFKQTIEKRNGK